MANKSVETPLVTLMPMKRNIMLCLVISSIINTILSRSHAVETNSPVEVTNELQIVIQLPKSTFEWGEPIPVTLVLSNRTSMAKVVPTSVVGIGIQFQMTNLTTGVAASPREHHGAHFSGPAQTALEPGKTLHQEADLLQLYKLGPGFYSVSGSKVMSFRPPWTEGLLTSETTTILVIDPKEQDAK